MDIFSLIYIFGIGFLVGFVFAGFVVSDFVMNTTKKIEEHIKKKEIEKEKIKRENKFNFYLKEYTEVLKRKKQNDC